MIEKSDKKLKLAIGVPTYNGQQWIKQCLNSVLKQSFKNFSVIVSDDCSTDKTINIIKSFKDKRIKIYQNKKNFGYAKNLQILKKYIKADILFLMAQDDILLKDALLKTYRAFFLTPNVGAVTRPYYWFDQNFKKPVRAIIPFSKNKDWVISIFDGKKAVKKIFNSIGQLSGLAYRTKYMSVNFHPATFVSHVYPFADIFKKRQVVFLKSYTVAVRIKSSQTRLKPSIYNFSPLKSWLTMFKAVYQEKKFSSIKKIGMKNIAIHYLGLIQIKNFANLKQLLKEIFFHLKYYPLGLLRPDFWLISLSVIILPKKILLWLTDNFKDKILAYYLKIKFDE